LLAAWLAGIPVRICHNHSTAHIGEGKKTILKYLLRPFAKIFATDYFACGETAGCWIYGNRCFRKGKIHIMPNAIDVRKFVFAPRSRQNVREGLGIGNGTFVVGHVGRFVYSKNHTFLIHIFRAFHRICPDSVLLLIREGELLPDIGEQVKTLGLTENVRFLGVRDDVNELFSAMDAFCLPSFYEGFPAVLIEAQANGLPCVISDVIAQESVLQRNVSCLRLSRSPEDWATLLKSVKRVDPAAAVQAYDTQICASRLEDYYLCRAVSAKLKK